MDTRTWKCPDCGLQEDFTQDWLADHGGPVCPQCDMDMELQAGSDEADDLHRLYARRESKMLGETYAGLEFDSYLTGPSGCAVVLFIDDDTQPEQIDRAKAEATQKRDVTGFTIHRMPKEWARAEKYEPQAEKKGWIDAIRWIVENKQCRRVIPETGELVPEDKSGGMLVDLFSASTMVQVYDALNETNKARLNAMDVRLAHRIVFQVLK